MKPYPVLNVIGRKKNPEPARLVRYDLAVSLKESRRLQEIAKQIAQSHGFEEFYAFVIDGTNWASVEFVEDDQPKPSS